VSAELSSASEGGRRRSSEVVAGYLAAFSIFGSLVGLAWHPLRLVGPTIILALVAAGMAGPSNRLARAAILIATVCFFLGLTIAVLGERPLW
jgi:hypothetical protein